MCDQCAHPLGPLELVPLFSFFWLRARCRHCGGAIDRVHLFAEVAALVVALWAATLTSGGIYVATCLLGWLLLTLALTDWRTLLLPDALTYTLLILGFGVTYLIDRGALLDHALGAADGFGVLGGIALIYRSIRGYEGLGLGDAKLLAGLGAWLSWHGLPSVLLLAAMLGLTVAFIGRLRGEPFDRKTKLPFGTFLAMSGWLVWLYGPIQFDP